MKNLFWLFCLSLVLSGFTTDPSVSFTLRNESVQSIPLVIPGVMNPNLSPMSDSGVQLEVGQKIFFKHKGRKYLLLEVSAEYEGTRIRVHQLIKQRKKEMGL